MQTARMRGEEAPGPVVAVWMRRGCGATPNEWPSGRPVHRPFRGLLGIHSRYGLHTRAVTVYRDPLSGGFSHFVHSCSGCVRLAHAKNRRWQKKDQNADVSRLDLPLSLRALNLQCLKLLHDNKGQIAQLF